LEWNDVARVIDVNIRGAFGTLVAAIPIMVAQQSGHLVGISSLAGRRGLPKTSAYSASKAALSTFLETLRLDLARVGIRVTDVRPGYVATPLTGRSRRRRPFIWPSDKAARVIAERLERAPAVVSFPWPLSAITSAARTLSPRVYDSLVRLS